MNRQIRTGLLMCCFFSIGSAATGQTTDQPVRPVDTAAPAAIQLPVPVKPAPVVRPKKPQPITKELSAGIRLNTDGWTVFAERGKSIYEDSKTSDKFYNLRLFQLEISEHKHAKEHKENYASPLVSDQDKTKPYILGKINNFYSVRLGYIFRKMIAGKPEPGTVSIHWTYGGGVAAGLLKPYYIDAYVPQDPKTGNFELVRKSIKYEEPYEEHFLSQLVIVGSSGWSKGLNELKVVPGLHAKTGLHFDFASHNKGKLAIETGIAGELYTKKIELMARQKSFPYLVSGYISIQFGKRW